MEGRNCSLQRASEGARRVTTLTQLLFVATAMLIAQCTHNVFAEDISAEGGETTVDDTSAQAYSKPLANLSDANSLFQHDLGEQGFRRNFASVRIGGKIVLGPKFNNVSCVGCHAGNGRGSLTFGRSTSESVVKVSATHGREVLPGGPLLTKGIGAQIRDHALKGEKSDGSLQVLWELVQGSYKDGEPFELRRPIVVRSGVSAKLPTDTMFSLRRPPPVFGLGLIDAVDPQTIQALADPDDSDGDGISGRSNLVWNLSEKRPTVGKFGFKAGAPSVLQQVAGAYATDMGVTNPLFPSGTSRAPELSQKIQARTAFYVQTLAVPKARDQDNPSVVRGRELFDTIGCGGCHVTSLQTGEYAIPELSHQIIHPFSDLLLHDMGEGLADQRPEFQATGSEWRTTPLWGLGLAELVLGGRDVSYLHDGRARTLEEAILWHSGEGQASRDTFIALEQNDRAQLIQFLRSL